MLHRLTRQKPANPDARTNKETYIRAHGGDTDLGLLKRYAYRVTDAVKKTIQGDVKNDPVAMQYIPQKAELKILPEEDTDPIGDDVHTPVKGIVHRYPDRVLFKLANVCAVYCRYCFRRETVGPGSDILKPEERTDALNYIRRHKDIWEVIFSGGDPFVVSPKQLGQILEELERIEHVQTIRFHTRVPVADPARITEEFCKIFDLSKPVYIALHINHVNEITEEVKTAIARLQKAGCVLVSQSVLLKGVNDNAAALEDLLRTLITLKVKPYYLHHPDLAPRSLPGLERFPATRFHCRIRQRLLKKLQSLRRRKKRKVQTRKQPLLLIRRHNNTA
jgi:lysine 2,3-aminomutase